MRLIDADVAKEMLKRHANEFSDVLSRKEKTVLVGGGTSCIDKCPTVDAAPVVRCKDCKHYEAPEKGIFETCMRNGHLIPMLPDDFCSWGESMDGGNEDG